MNLLLQLSIKRIGMPANLPKKFYPTNCVQWWRQHWRPASNDEMCVFCNCGATKNGEKTREIFIFFRKIINLNAIFQSRSVLPWFIEIKRRPHFSNTRVFNPDTHRNPKLSKIWPVFKNIEGKFRKFYTPNRDITIDESLLSYKGRLRWRKFIFLKKARHKIIYAEWVRKCICVGNHDLYRERSAIDRQYGHLPMLL